MFFSDVFLHKLMYFQSVNGCNQLSLQQRLRKNHLHVQRLAKLDILTPRCVLTAAFEPLPELTEDECRRAWFEADQLVDARVERLAQ